jgi:PhnB protein
MCCGLVRAVIIESSTRTAAVVRSHCRLDRVLSDRHTIGRDPHPSKESIMAQAIPAGYHSVTPYLIVAGAAKAIDFYKRAFGATEVMCMKDPSGKVGHAEIKIGDSHVMLADEHPERGYRGPTSLGGAAVALMVYVENVDSVFKQALACGAQELQPLQDQFYGDRSGTLKDPFGHVWTVATHMEDIPPAEMERRARQYMQKQNA